MMKTEAETNIEYTKIRVNQNEGIEGSIQVSTACRVLEMWKDMSHQEELLDTLKNEENRDGGANLITHVIADVWIVLADFLRSSEAYSTTANTNKASILSVDSSVNYWVLDLRASFHTTADHNIMLNYVARNYGMVYVVDDMLKYFIDYGDTKFDYRLWDGIMYFNTKKL